MWTVIVLGDINHSPRMKNHIDMLQVDHDVQVIAYGSLNGVKSLSLPNFQIQKLYLLWSAIKFALQSIYLIYYLVFYPSKYILIQNPPSLPVLFALWFIKLFCTRVVILDWHNLGYTILKTRMDGAVVQIYKKLENSLSRVADVHLTVSNEMKDFLENTWNLKNVKVLYDHPPELFKPFSENEKSNFWSILSYYPECHIVGNISIDNVIKIVTGTSYTPDEDIFMLLEALHLLDKHIKADGIEIITFITGRGPLRPIIEQKIKSLELKHVHICCVWLKYEDYPKLLALCDVGISLHYSSSGLDLPMKIWDMFGCGLPVFALNYKALPELVLKSYGYTFQDANSLFQLLVSYKDGLLDLKTCSNEIIKDFKNKRWEKEWKDKMSEFIE